mgnify:CR=1 FL=1
MLTGFDEVAQGKPAPDVYLMSVHRLGQDPARCVAFEDSDLGTAAAHAAHGAARGGGERGDGGRQQAEHPAEVAEGHLGLLAAQAPHAARARAAELVHLLIGEM